MWPELLADRIQKGMPIPAIRVRIGRTMVVNRREREPGVLAANPPGPPRIATSRTARARPTKETTKAIVAITGWDPNGERRSMTYLLRPEAKLWAGRATAAK